MSANLILFLVCCAVFAWAATIAAWLDAKNDVKYYKKIWKESNALLEVRFREGVEAERERIVNQLAPKRKISRAIVTHALNEGQEPKCPPAPGTSVGNYWH